MRAFAEAWPETVIVHQPGAQLPWKHHCLLLDKLDTPADRLWYAAKAVEHGWSRDVLALQIESRLHARQGKAITNFKTTLPPLQLAKLVDSLPKSLKGAVPSVAELEKGLASGPP